MHHHVFDTMTAAATVNHAGLKILHLDHLKPCHIIILASRADRAVDNSRFLRREGKHWKRSPFPSDHSYHVP